MKIIYVTLENSEQAKTIAHDLLEKKLTNCVNFFPITCIYNYDDKITEEPEVVLIIKTKAELYDEIKDIIKRHIQFDNFIGQFEVDKINDDFSSWLNNIVR